MIVINNKPNKFQPRFKPNSLSPKLSPQIKPIWLFTQTSDGDHNTSWVAHEHSSLLMGRTLAETLHVIWFQLINVGKRFLIRSKVHVFTDSFEPMSRCCMQEHICDQVQGHLVHMGFSPNTLPCQDRHLL